MNEEASIKLRGFLTIWDLVHTICPHCPPIFVAAPFGRPPSRRACEHMKGKVLVADSNIVVTLGRQRVAYLITGLNSSFVSDLAIGDGGAPQIDLMTPIVPTLADTDLAHELDRTSVINPSVVGQELTFQATFLTASLTPIDFIDPANKVINEAGLFAGDDTLFARKTFESIPFSPGDRTGSVMNWVIEIQ